MTKKLERLKILLINIWPTYDLSVRTEVGRKSTIKYTEYSEPTQIYFLTTAQAEQMFTKWKFLQRNMLH
jgi:hypothetical protein